MSEKRFTWKIEKLQHSDDEVLLVIDNENKEWKGHILNIVDLLNYQDRLIEEQHDEIINWTKKYVGIKKENEELKSIKRFAENNGINIFHIDTAFRNCWKDNANLVTKIRKQEDEISYWKHKVSSLLWILGQFDEEKVKELLKELEDE